MPNPYRSTLLHTAAMHSRTDCIPQLLSKSVNATALDSQGTSSLRLACLYSDFETIQLLFDSGGWLDSLATACMLNTIISGNFDALELLLERGISCSDVIDDDTGYTLMHAAAAYGRHECAGMLMRHGYTATTLANNGESAVDVVFASTLPDVLKLDNIIRPEWSERAATVLMLLKSGCDYNVSRIIHNDECAAVIKQYYDELRDESVKQQQLLQLHAIDTYSRNDDTSGNATTVQVLR
jgi:ankyrin repeat protein